MPLQWILEQPTEAPEKPQQTRKTHRKSREGCLTCKSRRVKVSMAQPSLRLSLMISATNYTQSVVNVKSVQLCVSMPTRDKGGHMRRIRVSHVATPQSPSLENQQMGSARYDRSSQGTRLSSIEILNLMPPTMVRGAALSIRQLSRHLSHARHRGLRRKQLQNFLRSPP